MPIDVEKEYAALERMTATQLAERYAELYGERTRSRHRKWLIRKIVWKIQTREAGGLSERAQKRAQELAADAELRLMPPKEQHARVLTECVTKVAVTTDPRLPVPGTTLVREYRGINHEVTVLVDGFEYLDKRYRSLTAVAREITGTHCNGYRFFGLGGGQ